jgi:hypothetical protein
MSRVLVTTTEIRALAQRSATAAKEIKELIGTTVDQVGEGATLVSQAGAPSRPKMRQTPRQCWSFISTLMPLAPEYGNASQTKALVSPSSFKQISSHCFVNFSCSEFCLSRSDNA